MSATTDTLNVRRVPLVASNPAVSGQTGWPIGFWWSELAHPYREFTEHGYEVDIASPDGGALQADSWRDARDAYGYCADDLISLGFLTSPTHAGLVEESNPLAEVTVADYDAVFFVGGQGPMYTFYDDKRVHHLAVEFYEAAKITAVVYHATCILLRARLSNGDFLVKGKTWTASPTPRRTTPTPTSTSASSRSGSKTKRARRARHQLRGARPLPSPRGTRRAVGDRAAAVLRNGGSPSGHPGARTVNRAGSVRRR